ncbi:hypothetical protein F383_28295 [Gossypium arboreum]|uniref:Uncharacterized protein n=1 Tax=Gossypium arboreum TaxID=29729 RepID=A0A0B0MYE7_GOSAR|nr:hypothetical protein F383_28295 [Gossypium arboreum]
MLHGCMSPDVDIKIKSVCSTRSHTRACDLLVFHKSISPIVLAWPSTQPSTPACVANSKGTWARHMGVWLAV